MTHLYFLSKQPGVVLTLILLTFLVGECNSVPTEYRAFLDLPPKRRQAEMRKVSLEKQLEYYFAGLDYVHPPDVGLTDPIAEQGKKALPFLLKKLSENTDEDKKADIVFILEVMHQSYCNLKNEEKVIALLKQIKLNAKSPRLKKESEDALSLILENKAPDPAKLLDDIDKD